MGARVNIGPYAIVGSKVRLGDDVQVFGHAMVSARSTIGARTQIWPYAHIGTNPQDLKYRGEDTELVCGEDNVFREYVNISIGTDGGGGKTQIGSKNLLMVNTHIAHDCLVGDHCIFANAVSLAGHVEVESRAVVGGHVAIHQFVKIGYLAMLAGGSIVVQDVPPFVLVQGDRAKPAGLNKVGLDRSTSSEDAIKRIKAIYKLLFQMSLTVDEAKEQIQTRYAGTDEAKLFLDFLQKSRRGLCR